MTFQRALAWTLVALVTAFLGLQAWYFAQVVMLARVDPDSSAYMVSLRERTGQPVTQAWVDGPAIAPALARAVLAAEDARFTMHYGVDWIEVARARADNVEQGRIVRGASTITMQLARNLFLSGRQNYWRKAQEVLIAFMLEAALGKQRILVLYLNLAQWGRTVFGAEAAARHYFGVPAARLSDEQAAWLAAILPSPAYYDEHRDTAYIMARQTSLLRQMDQVRLP
ncbi:MAG: monofunctional biosynthetic peptidoglycan transglycosylase [Burkholderiaceae bacterium]